MNECVFETSIFSHNASDISKQTRTEISGSAACIYLKVFIFSDLI